MPTFHSMVIRKVIEPGVNGEVGWMPSCTCEQWKTATLCGTYQAAERSWENNHVAHFMDEEEIQAKKKEAREKIRNRVLSKFIEV